MFVGLVNSAPVHECTVHEKSQHSWLKKKKCDVGNAESKPHLVGLDKGEA